MSEDALEPAPKPPGLGFYIHLLAVLLELGMLVRFIDHGDRIGIVIWAIYFWYSATRDMAVRLIRGDL